MNLGLSLRRPYLHNSGSFSSISLYAQSSQSFTFTTKLLEVGFVLINFVVRVWFFQSSLFVRINFLLAAFALLVNVTPTISTLPSFLTSTFEETKHSFYFLNRVLVARSELNLSISFLKIYFKIVNKIRKGHLQI